MMLNMWSELSCQMWIKTKRFTLSFQSPAHTERITRGGAKTGKITELFVSAEGKGGCKITLKPK